MKVLGCVRDLMFSTRIRDTARRHGHDCRIVTRAADVEGNLAGADLVVIDLMVPGGGALEAVSAATSAGVTVVAYGEHVQADVLQAGRDAGADEVLTRSEFTRRLDALLAEGAGASAGDVGEVQGESGASLPRTHDEA